MVRFAVFANKRSDAWKWKADAGKSSLADEVVAAKSAIVERRQHAPEVLTCSQCGAPVELVDAAETPCRHCSARVAVPAEYIALLRARATAQAQATLEARELAATERWVTRRGRSRGSS